MNGHMKGIGTMTRRMRMRMRRVCRQSVNLGFLLFE